MFKRGKNTTLPILPKVNTPLPKVQRQNLLHFKTGPKLLTCSNQPFQETQNYQQNIQMTAQRLVYLSRQLKTQSNQAVNNAPMPSFLQANSTPTTFPAVRRNSQMMYPHLRGSAPMQQLLRPFDGADQTYTTEDFSKIITA